MMRKNAELKGITRELLGNQVIYTFTLTIMFLHSLILYFSFHALYQIVYICYTFVPYYPPSTYTAGITLYRDYLYGNLYQMPILYVEIDI